MVEHNLILKYIKKRSDIFLFGILITVALLWYSNKADQIYKNREILNCKVDSYSRIRNGNPKIDCRFSYNGIAYKATTSVSVSNPSEYFIGNYFSVAIDSTNPNRSIVLIYHEDLKDVGLPLRDSTKYFTISRNPF